MELCKYFYKEFEKDPEKIPKNSELIYFYSIKKSGISIKNYIKRLLVAINAEEVLVCALLYIYRIKKRRDEFILNEYSFHRIYATCLLLAIKNKDDFYYDNSYYATLFGLSNKELNHLELILLRILENDIFIREQDYKEFYYNNKSLLKW